MSVPIVGSEPTPPGDLNERLKRLLIILCMVLIVVAGVYAMKAVLPFLQWMLRVLTPFIIGLILAYVLNPLVHVIQRKLKLGRGGALGIVVLILFIMLVGLVGLLALLIAQVDDVYRYVNDYVQNDMGRQLQKLGTLFPTGSTTQPSSLPYELYQQAKQYMGEVDWRGVATSVLPGLRQGTLGVAHGIIGGVTGFISIIVVTVFVAITCFYYLLDFHKIPRIMRIMVPDEREPRMFNLFNRIDESVGGFLRGQLIDCMCVGVLVTMFMLAWGPRRWALLIGFVAGAVNFIPYLGPISGAVPAVLWALFTPSIEGLTPRLIRVAYIIGSFWLVQLIDNLVLQPKIVGKHAQLHPLAVLFALFVGAQFGLAGMIVAVPTACIVRVLIKELWWDRLADDERRREIRES